MHHNVDSISKQPFVNNEQYFNQTRSLCASDTSRCYKSFGFFLLIAEFNSHASVVLSGSVFLPVWKSQSSRFHHLWAFPHGSDTWTAASFERAPVCVTADRADRSEPNRTEPGQTADKLLWDNARMTALSSWEVCVKYAIFVFNFFFWVSFTPFLFLLLHSTAILQKSASLVSKLRKRTLTRFIWKQPILEQIWYCIHIYQFDVHSDLIFPIL